MPALFLVVQEGRPFYEFAVALESEVEANEAAANCARDGNVYQLWRVEPVTTQGKRDE
jgi:hypothetical protein